MKNKARFIRSFGGLISGLLSVAIPVVSAQTLRYENEGQILGAAMVSPNSIQQILSRLVRTCSTENPALRATGEQELRAWEARHQLYLDASASIRREVEARHGSSSADPVARQALKNMLEVSVPKAIDAQYESVVAPVKIAGSQVDKATVCRSYLQSIANREWDLRVNDPVLTDFFDQRIKKSTR